MNRRSDILSQARAWAIAVRPFAYTASGLSVLLGLALAMAAGYSAQWFLFLLTLIGVLAFQSGANLLNDCYDFSRGLDRAVMPTSGSIVRGMLTSEQVRRGGYIALGVGVVIGLILTWLAGWTVLVLGLCGMAIALTYTAGRFCLKYHGLGDLGIFLAFGVLSVVGSFYVQAQDFQWFALVWSLPMGSYTVGILHSNNWRDINRDLRCGCVTPAGLLGPGKSRIYYQWLLLGPYAFTAVALLAAQVLGRGDLAPWTLLLVFLSFPRAWSLATRDWPASPKAFMMIDGFTAQQHLFFGVLLCLSFFLAALL